MKPLIALVGRPNVGKSTLFNCLTRSRDALVADQPGLTRDRRYGIGKVGRAGSYRVVDTGGIEGGEEGIDSLVAGQAQYAIAEAYSIFFIVDGRTGLSAADEMIAAHLRNLNKTVYLLVNKTDGLDEQVACAEFHELGLSKPVPIAATHGRNVTQFMTQMCEQLPTLDEDPMIDDDRTRVCIVGRPNVGKSTLVNRLLGEERVLAYDKPGTTRDSIFIPFERNGRLYTLIDTAGVRRRGKVRETIEKFSVVKTLDAIDHSHVVVLVVDAQAGITEQDAHLLGMVLDSGRALVLAINKWDGLDDEQKDHARYSFDRRLSFIDFAKIHRISALYGSGVGDVIRSVDAAYKMSTKRFSTNELTELLQFAVEKHAPPQAQGRAIKLRYAHQGGQNPPLFIIHGNRTDQLTEPYKRYLINTFRETLKLYGTPIRVDFKTSKNPYQGKKNELTDRQQKKRKRLKHHLKKRAK